MFEDVRESILKQEAAGDLSIAAAYVDLASGESWHVAPHRAFHAASTMKVGVMLEVFRRAHDGDLSLDQEVPITNRFKSLVGGTPYSLSPEDDSDPGLYEKIGGVCSVGELVRRMIVMSGNLATNELLELVGAESVDRLMSSIGADGVRTIRGVEDTLAYRNGLNNTATAFGLARLFTLIGRREVVSREACDQMIAILLAQEHNEGIPSGLDSSSRVAHKTGWIGKFYHDAGIVYPEGGTPFVWVVLTEGAPDLTSGGVLVGELTKLMVSSRSFAQRTLGNRNGLQPSHTSVESASQEDS